MEQELKDKKRHIIIAPHADDEIIGCYSILKAGEVSAIYFPEKEIMVEAKIVMECFVVPNMFTITEQISFHNLALTATRMNGSIFFPDPVYEWHPEHRRWGSIGQELVRKGHSNVIFYSVNMTAPYIREVNNPDDKRKALNTVYPEKRNLWKYDHKYFLFEGHCQWLTNENLCQD